MDSPPKALDPGLLSGLSVYQDVVLDGQTVLPGVRDCAGRWSQIAPHLPPLGTVLDIGSNFGWFGWRLCEHEPACVVCSVEADERSATVQRRVLASHRHERIALVTRPAGAALARTFVAAGQRFDAVLCLAVLHWIGDHRQLLETLGPLAGRIFVEQPDPREPGAGVERIRREIGSIGPYLRELFPERRVRLVAELASYREAAYTRQLWLVEEPAGWPDQPVPGVDAAALMSLAPSWPRRTWWQEQLASLAAGAKPSDQAGILLTASGLQRGSSPSARCWRQWQRLVRRIPESETFSWRERWRRRGRSMGGSLLRAFGAR